MQLKLTYHRRKTTQTRVGNLFMGSDYPIRIQTMANTSTNDIDASVEQTRRCIESGAELLRFTTQGIREVESLREIHAQVLTAVPLVADVHFQADVADAAAQVVEKVRINPGNYIDPARKFKHIDYTDNEYHAELQRLEARFIRLLNICKENQTAIRLGVNHGSLSDRIMSRYGDTPAGMVESVMEFLRVATQQQFANIVISIKASNTRVMVETVRLLVKQMDKEHMAYPLHLGVTEAGEGEDGRIKSAVGIGALLAEGIGDTIRVSLSEAPENEIPVAQQLADYFADEDSPRYDGTIITEVLDQIGSEAEIRYSSLEDDWSIFCLQAAAETGRLLWDYDAKELTLINPNFSDAQLTQLSKDILQADAAIKLYKKMLSLYLKNKYGLKKVLHRTDDCISLIDTATYMKNCIAYILRNAVCARICAKPEDYRWSSYACYFSDTRSEKSFLVSELTFSQKRKMLRTGMDLRDCPLRITEDGLVALDSFVRSDIVERVYRYSGKSFLYYMGCCNDARMEYELTCQPLMHVSDQDMYETVTKYVAVRFHGKDLAELTSAEKCSILKHLFFNSKTSVPQISRIMGLPRQLVRRILST